MGVSLFVIKIMSNGICPFLTHDPDRKLIVARAKKYFRKDGKL
jgi:hypothetical protein